MSIHDVYVRCRDGALYKNPTLVFEDGFICFSAIEAPELVLWATDKTGAPKTDLGQPPELLARIFGPGVTGDLLGQDKVEQRVIPGTDPWVYRPALGIHFRLTARIPRPQMHDGFERYARRCGSTKILDWPSLPRDAYELDFKL